MNSDDYIPNNARDKYLGKRFLLKHGWARVIAYANTKQIRIEFEESGSKVYCRVDQLMKGTVKDPKRKYNA